MAVKKRKNNDINPPVPKKQVITVNPYENPENVMELMTKICAAESSVDTDVYWDEINRAFFDTKVRGKCLVDYIYDNRDSLSNCDFYHDLKQHAQQLFKNLQERDNMEHTKVVVAGGFSAGKSSFLNMLTKSWNMLPTGVEAVSVVKTYLYCLKNKRNVTVKGVNHKNVLVTLDNGVLQAIQHTNESSVCLASVLDKLFVEIPSAELDGVVFIDTPGYDNSDKANKSNGKTDKETTIGALKEGKDNVLFWLTDSERSVITTADLEMIKEFEGKKVFIYNKAEQNGEKESKKIIDSEAKKLYNEFPKEEIIDVIAFSTIDNKIYYSKNNYYSFNEIINDIKKCGNGISEQTIIKNNIEFLFDFEIDVSNNVIENIKTEYNEASKVRDKKQKEYHNIKYRGNPIINKVRDVLIDNYDDIDSNADDLRNLTREVLDAFNNLRKEVSKYNDSRFFSSGELSSITKKTSNKYSNYVSRFDGIYWISYSNKDRKDYLTELKTAFVSEYEKAYKVECEKCQNLLKRKEKEEQKIKDMKDYKRIFMSALEQGIRNYNKKNSATDIQVETKSVPNVFECIQKNDYKAFLRSFENGVDMAVCNPDGYSPMTLAVQKGNDMMVKFMLDHEADPAIKDRRGYNAFHTAVENQYRDICKMLLDCAPDLIETKTAKGETVEELANKQTFKKWIENEINNTF